MKLSKAFLPLLFLFVQNIYAQVHTYNTAHLLGTAGSGVASVLAVESTILNPASLGFFNMRVISGDYQKLNIESYDEGRGLSESDFKGKSRTWGSFFADSKSRIKYAAGYIDQREGDEKRRTFTTSSAYTIKNHTSIGIAYRRRKDDFSAYQKKYQQTVIGILHTINEDLTLGLVIEDPFKAHAIDTKITLGLQYVIKKKISLIFDLGTDPFEDFADNIHYRFAMQFNVFSSLFLRAGFAQDEKIKEESYGAGLSWIGKRFSLGAGIKYIKPKDDRSVGLLEDEKMRVVGISSSFSF